MLLQYSKSNCVLILICLCVLILRGRTFSSHSLIQTMQMNICSKMYRIKIVCNLDNHNLLKNAYTIEKGENKDPERCNSSFYRLAINLELFSAFI